MSDSGFLARLEVAPQIGLVCGDSSGGVVCIDLDDDKVADRFRATLPADMKTLMIQGNRGLKFVYIVSTGTAGKRSNLYRGETKVGDWLANGSHAVVHGLHHESGLPYKCLGSKITSTTVERLRGQLGHLGITSTCCRPHLQAVDHIDTDSGTDSDIDSDKEGIRRGTGSLSPQKCQPSVVELIEAERGANQRLGDAPQALRKLYEVHVKPHFAGAPHARNDFLINALNMLLRRVSPDVARELVGLHWRLYREIYRATEAEHLREAEALIGGIVESYRSKLPQDEQHAFELLSELEEAAARICRDLARAGTVNARGPHFFLSAKQLGDRVQRDTRIGHSLLGALQRYGLLQMLEKGRRWAAGIPPRATTWRWLGSIEEITGADPVEKTVSPGETINDA
jgi:hypothetical protein